MNVYTKYFFEVEVIQNLDQLRNEVDHVKRAKKTAAAASGWRDIVNRESYSQVTS